MSWKVIELIIILALIPTNFFLFKYVPDVFNFFLAMAIDLGIAFVILEKRDRGIQ